MNNFQTILTAIFLACFVFAVLIFSGLLKIGGNGGSATTPVGKLVIWGTFTNPDLSSVFDTVTQNNKDLTISYVKKSPATYQQDLLEAFANGTGPDLFFITPDMIQQDQNFVYKIPYANYPKQTFQDAFIDGASVYLTPDGVIGFPVVVDPMVMYYNKDILANNGIATPPTSWDQLFALVPELTKKQNDGSIQQSMIALGQYDNITNAKDIIATLLLQAGDPIVSMNDTGGYESVLNTTATSSMVGGTSPSDQALNFFTEFSNPSDPAYSWNRSLPNSIDMFTSGKLAFYLGHASELFTIQSINPNLSFNVTSIPQTKGTTANQTSGTIYALAVSKKSANITAAFGLTGILTTGDTAASIAQALSLPPASLTALATKPTDNPYLYTFFNQALITKTWPDPDPTATDAIFSEMINNILSSKLSVDDALSKAHSELGLIVKN
jgi:ABC-type glycerol-3-phosphate transport system substrate-binding protein